MLDPITAGLPAATARAICWRQPRLRRSQARRLGTGEAGQFALAHHACFGIGVRRAQLVRADARLPRDEFAQAGPLRKSQPGV